MSWKVVMLTDDSKVVFKGSRLRDEFMKIFIANGSPTNATMYGGKATSDCNKFWFSPKAAEIAKPLMELYGAKECEAPDTRLLTLLVQNSGA